MILEDCIMLARTVPEPSKKYGVRVCSVAYSPELRRLIRIYPLMVGEKISQRHTFRVKLKRNNMDSRDESFKKVAYSLTGNVIGKGELEPILMNLMVDDISDLNARKKSLGVIKAESGSYYVKMKSKKDVKDNCQLFLFKAPNLSNQKFLTGQDYKHIPYVVIPSQKCQKNIQIRDWGTYILLAKNNGCISDKYLSEIFKNDDVYFVVGNMNGCRTVWIACSFYVYQSTDQMNMFQMGTSCQG
jgi:hypothetical protein